MRDPYTDRDYASGRLYGTVVRLECGTPVHVDSTEDYDEYCVRTLHDKKSLRVDPDTLDLNPFELGNVQSKNKSFYVARLPSRQWKQGLRFSQLNISQGFSGLSVWCKEFRQMLSGEYNNIEETFDLLFNEEIESAPISRQFSLGTPHTSGVLPLVFKDTKVGVVKPNSKVLIPKFAAKYSFLTEFFEDSIRKSKVMK